MQKELKNITENVMDEIHLGKAKMKPKIYFVVGSVLTFVGVVSSATISIFLIGLIKFSLRNHSAMGQYRLDQMISNFPWWTMLFAIVGLSLGLWLIRQYDFSYKKEPLIIILSFILTIVVIGWTIDSIGFNDVLLKHGPMRGIMNKYIKSNTIRGNSQKWMIDGRIKNNQVEKNN